MRIADRLKQLCLDAGHNPRQVKSTLAAICNVSYQATRAWFIDSDPTPENIAKIAQHFDANAIWLITGNGDKKTIHLNSDEQRIIEGWRKISIIERKVLMQQQIAYIKFLEQANKKQ